MHLNLQTKLRLKSSKKNLKHVYHVIKLTKYMQEDNHDLLIDILEVIFEDFDLNNCCLDCYFNSQTYL